MRSINLLRIPAATRKCFPAETVRLSFLSCWEGSSSRVFNTASSAFFHVINQILYLTMADFCRILQSVAHVFVSFASDVQARLGLVHFVLMRSSLLLFYAWYMWLVEPLIEIPRSSWNAALKSAFFWTLKFALKACLVFELMNISSSSIV